MTVENAPKPVATKPTDKRALEFIGWVIAPVALAFCAYSAAAAMRLPTGDVEAFVGAIVLVAGAYFLFKPNKEIKLGRARGAGMIYAGLVAALMGSSSGSNTSAPEPQKTAAVIKPISPDEIAVQAEARKKAAAEEAIASRADYIAGLETALAGATPEQLLENIDTPESAVVTVAAFAALAGLYEDGATFELSKEQQALRHRFKSRLIDLQSQTFPKLRERYGAALARKKWENNMEVETLGAGNWTIQFVWGGLASSSNIADFHTAVAETLTTLRFKRAQYKWIPSAERLSYYELEAPGDRDLMVLRNDKFFRLAEEPNDVSPPAIAKHLPNTDPPLSTAPN